MSSESSQLSSCMECGVCYEQYTSEGAHIPRLLECGHTLCEQCAGTLMSDVNIAMSNIRCPFDKHLTRVSHARCLKKNFAFIELMSRMNVQRQEGESDHTEALITLTSVVERYGSEAEKTKAALEQKTAEANTLTQQVHEKEEKLSQLQLQLALANQEITDAKHHVADLETQITNLQVSQQHLRDVYSYKLYTGLRRAQCLYKSKEEANFHQIQFRVNRKSVECQCADAMGTSGPLRTVHSLLIQFQGQPIPFAEVYIGEQLGSGCHGNAHFGVWKRTVVCVKILNLTFESKKKFSLTENELREVCTLEHNNLLRYFNVCKGEQQQMGIIMEYAQMSLHELLHANETIELSETKRLDLLRDVCSGLEFLHSRGLPHCNLTSTNVLIDIDKDKLCAKLTDYGLTLVREADTDNGELVRTLNVTRFSAPEVLNEKFLRGADLMMADVYSASLVIYHVAFNMEPFHGIPDHQFHIELAQSCIEPQTPRHVKINAVVSQVMKAGWNFNPSTRPKASEVLQKLKEANTLYIQ